jgi:hypothetical protein
MKNSFYRWLFGDLLDVELSNILFNQYKKNENENQFVAADTQLFSSIWPETVGPG